MTTFRGSANDPRRTHLGQWTPEGRKEAADRMPTFAREFFGRLFAEYPDLERGAVFLHWSIQPEDVYAFFDRPPGFAVQIDTALEYILVLTASTIAEHGDWGNYDFVQFALDHVRSFALRGDG